MEDLASLNFDQLCDLYQSIGSDDIPEKESRLKSVVQQILENSRASTAAYEIAQERRERESKELVETLSREQVNTMIPVIREKLDEFKVALEKESSLPDRPVSNCVLIGRSTPSPEELARSLSTDQLRIVRETIAYRLNSFYWELLCKLVSGADGLIQAVEKRGDNISAAISVLTPLELLMHMHFSAYACALRENPELEGEALEKQRVVEFNKFFGHTPSENKPKKESHRKKKSKGTN